MRKKLLTLFLAVTMALSLLPPPTPALAAVLDPERHRQLLKPILDVLPTDLRRPACPTTVKEVIWSSTMEVEWDDSVVQEIADLANSLTAGKSTDKEKMKAIFDWVIQNVTYDRNLPDDQREAFDAYTQRRATCWGYTRLCGLMGVIVGLRMAEITGISNEENPGLHGWNAVLLDGEWLFFDATWAEWDIDQYYHAWTAAIVYDDIYRWDIRATEKGTPNMIGFAPRPAFVDRCPANVVIPDTVTQVETFYGCPNLETLTLSDSVTRIVACGNNPKLRSVTFGKGITNIGSNAFSDCTGLKSINIPNTVTTIEGMAFSNTGLTSVTIPSSVTTLSEGAFYECADLTSVTIPSSVTRIESMMFQGCTSLTDVVIPDSVTAIGRQAFMGCYNLALANLHIPDSVTEIGDLAFFGCPETVGVPDDATSIGDEAFYGRKELTSIDIPDSVTSIGVAAFTSCHGLKSVTIPNSVTVIGDRAFCDCKSLESVTIPNSVTSIGTGAFAGCENLTSVTISNSVISIERSVFSGCTSLTSVTIPNGVASIEMEAFRDCASLKSVTIPSSVTSIRKYAFQDCASLTDVYYGGTEEQWKAISIQQYNTNLTSATIHYNSTMPQQPAKPTQAVAYASTQNVLVDGKSVEFYAYALKDVNGNDTNYVKLRDVAQILNGSAAQFEVGWDGSISITTRSAYTSNGSELIQNFAGNQPYTVNTSPVKVNGAAVALEAITLTDATGGYTYFKLRDLGSALGFNVGYANGTGIFIQTDAPYTDAD